MAREEKIDRLLKNYQSDRGTRSNRTRIESVLNEINYRNQEKERRLSEAKFKFDFTPRSLYEELDKYVMGQEEPRQRICNAICYHYKGLGDEGKNKKCNVLMIGPTGCGKTYVLEKISEIIDVPLLISDATKFSGTGYVGENVESLVHELLLKAQGDVSLASKGMIYIDEIDKIASSQVVGRDVSGRDVQNGLLKIVENSEVKVSDGKSVSVMPTKDILFIAGGAFSSIYDGLRKDNSFGFSLDRKNDLNDGEILADVDAQTLIKSLEKYGLIPEFLGRFPVLARFNQLSKDDLVEILKKSKDSPIISYTNDFKNYGIKISFSKDSYDTIANLAEERGVGARGLKSVLEEFLTPLKFNLPGLGIKKFEISSQTILEPDEFLVSFLDSQLNKFKEDKNG